MKQPLVVAYGAGVDSTAVLVEFSRRGIKIDLILMADTGGEKPGTYGYLPVVQEFLRSRGMPEVVTVRRRPTKARNGRGTYSTLEENCLINQTLPSLAFGYKKCSLKWKREPQDKFCDTWAPAVGAWAAGTKVRKVIGYDAGPKDARRSKISDDEKYEYWYPLREWGWDRDRCEEEIRREGLPVPQKSACFFCPASKPHEIEALTRDHPDLAERICAMEKGAEDGPHGLVSIEGLWRKSTRKRPGSMSKFIRGIDSAGKDEAA